MGQGASVIFAIVVIPTALVLIWIGWRNRKKRQSGIPELPHIPELGAPLRSVEGQYVTTTRQGDWLDRITVHGLGVRTRARVDVYDEGLLIIRFGARDVFIPAGSVREVRSTAGMAGKFVENDGIVVFSWFLEPLESPGQAQAANDAALNSFGIAVDTGFRPRLAAERDLLIAAAERFLPETAAEHVTPPENSKAHGQRAHDAEVEKSQGSIGKKDE